MEQPEHTYDVFISYAEADGAWVEGYLLDALDDAGVNYHSEEAFALGAPRLLEFERAIKASKRVLLVVSPAYLVEQFSLFVDVLVQSYGLETATWPAVPLILHPVELPPRLQMLLGLDATDPAQWDQVVARLCVELGKPAPQPLPTPACPYMGMVPYSEADSERFFGRDREARELIERLHLHPFATVIGPSGSGKSSLVYAGLIPALRKSGLFDKDGPSRDGSRWLVCSMRPGESPVDALVDALGGESSKLRSLDQIAERALATQPDARRLLLIVDQFEELFTLSTRDVDAFEQALAELSTLPQCYVVLTVRADFYAELMSTSLWPEIQQHRFEVLPMDEESLRQAILWPAENLGVYVEASLVERLVADAAGEPGILPLVQETMLLLWERLERRFLPLRAYEALVLSRAAYGDGLGKGLDVWPGRGERTGLQVAIARRAEAALGELSMDQQVIARRIFTRLIQFGEGRADTRRQQPVSALRSAGDSPAVFDQTLGHLVASRLLTMSGKEGEADRRVDIAHEALILGWPTLHRWLDERREVEQTRRRLEGKAGEWVRLGQGSGGLLDQVELMEAERWLGSPDSAELGYSETLSALVSVSRAAIEEAEREKEAARRRELDQARALAEEQERRAEEQARATRRLRGLLVGLALVLVVALVSAVFAFRESNAATRARQTEEVASTKAVAQEYTAVAERGTAVVASTKAVAQENTAVAERATAEAASTKAVAQEYTAVAERATAEAASTVAIAARQEAETERERAEEQAEIALSRQLAIQSSTHLETRFDLALLLSLEANHVADTRESKSALLTALQYHPRLIKLLRSDRAQPVVGVAFGPDGRLLASSNGLEVGLWNVETGQAVHLPLSLAGEAGAVPVPALDLGLAFSPDGKTVAVAADNQVVLWNVETGESERLPPVHQGQVTALTFGSGKDNVLASGSDDKMIVLWDLATKRPLGQPLVAHQSGVRSLAFAPDGRMLASGALGEVCLWDVSTSQLLQTLPAHQADVSGLAFAPDGQTLLSAGRDNSIRRWKVSDAGLSPLSAAQSIPDRTYKLPGPGAPWSVALTSAGSALAVGRFDPVIVWDIDGNQPIVESLFRAHYAFSDGVNGAAVHPNGGVLALGGMDGAITLWDISPKGSVVDTTATILDAAFTPDGKILTLGEEAGGQAVWLWSTGVELSDGELVTEQASQTYSMALAPDGRILALGGEDGTVRLWNLDAMQPVGELFVGQRTKIDSLAFGPDLEILASVSADGVVQLWDVDSFESVDALFGDEHAKPYAVAFNSASTAVFLALLREEGTVEVWDLQQDPYELILTAPQGTAVALNSDGSILAVGVCAMPQKPEGCAQGGIQLWDVDSEQIIGEMFRGHSAAVSHLAFSADDRVLLSVGEEGTVLLWDLDFESWKARACSIANRSLDQEEWEKYLSDHEYHVTCQQAMEQ